MLLILITLKKCLKEIEQNFIFWLNNNINKYLIDVFTKFIFIYVVQTKYVAYFNCSVYEKTNCIIFFWFLRHTFFFQIPFFLMTSSFFYPV